MREILVLALRWEGEKQMSATELEKWADAQPSLIIVQEFLEWCAEHQMELAVWSDNGRRLLPLLETKDSLLARFAGVDLQKLENERCALLENCRAG